MSNNTENTNEVEVENYLDLIDEAIKIFQKSYPGAILFSVVGTPESGVAKTANDLKNWIYKASISATENKIAQMEFTNGKFGEPKEIGSWIGLMFKQVRKDKVGLDQAIDILNKNGYTEGFSNFSLGTPVVEKPEQMFWFCVDLQTQGVSTSSGKFYENLAQCSPDGMGSSEE